MVHRGIGYTFAAIYMVMLPVMLPRLWTYQELTASSIVHAGTALIIGPLLIFKVLVVRNVIPLGAKLPWIGGTLVLLTGILIGVAAPPAFKLQSGPAGPGRAVATSRCVQCHGPSRIVKSDDDWSEIAEKMVERARKSGRQLTQADADLAARYLQMTLPRRAREDDEGRHGRGRGRGNDD